MSINQRVKEVMERHNDTQADLARKMKVSPQYISRILKEEDKGIGLDFINLFTDVYSDANIHWLIKGEYKDSDKTLDVLKDNPEKYQTGCSNCIQLQKIIDHQDKIITRFERELEELRERSKNVS